MRDFNRNGKIDGHDWHIYDMGCRKRLEILKRNDFPSSHSTPTSDKENQKEIGCLPILLVNIVLLILLEVLKSI